MHRYPWTRRTQRRLTWGESQRVFELLGYMKVDAAVELFDLLGYRLNVKWCDQ